MSCTGALGYSLEYIGFAFHKCLIVCSDRRANSIASFRQMSSCRKKAQNERERANKVVSCENKVGFASLMRQIGANSNRSERHALLA